MKKKLLLVLTFFVLNILAQEKKISAFDYYLTNKDGYIGQPILYSNNIEKRDTINYSKNELAIISLKEEISDLKTKISNLEGKTFEKNKAIYAGCVTTVPYLKIDLDNINTQINIYENSISTIKDRNLVKNEEFKKWFDLYSDFIKKQSDINLDINQIKNLNTSNVVDFILSSITTILTNSKSSKELRKSSQLMFQIISKENSFYKSFETQIETKYLDIVPLYKDLSLNIEKYIKGKENIMPTKLVFEEKEVNYFVQNLNSYYDDKIKTVNGYEELRDDKIAFYGILEKYFVLKNKIKELNNAFEKIQEKPSINSLTSENQNAIEMQLKQVFLLLHGL